MKKLLSKFLSVAAAYSLPLIFGIIIALIWANISPGSYHAFVDFPLFGSEFTVHFLVKDVFMAIFFAIAMTEITEAVRPGGAMYPIKKALNPLMATVGGVVGPVVIYVLMIILFDCPEYIDGWGIVTATDIAIAWLGAKLIFGPSHPAVKYLLLLAVADDAIGLLIIGIFYPTAPIEYSFLLLCVFGMLIAFVLRAMHVQHYGYYLILGGIPCWLGLYLANIEPALGLVFVVPFIPSVHRKEQMIIDGVVPRDPDHLALETFYWHWKPVADYGLFFFGLVSAGVMFSSIGVVTLIVAVSLILGKALGIFFFGFVGSKIGFHLPEGMTKTDLVLVATVAGVGLTVSLFICDAAFTDETVIGAAKMGALFSIAAVLSGYGVSKLVKKRPLKSLEEKETEL